MEISFFFLFPCYLAYSSLMSIATQYCNCPFTCKMLPSTREVTETRDFEDQRIKTWCFWKTNLLVIIHAARAELLNTICIRITDNSILTRFLSLLWSSCHVLQDYKTFTKSRCCEVGWGHRFEVWNVQNSVTCWQLRPYVWYLDSETWTLFSRDVL